MNKKQQKELLKEIMEADERDGLYSDISKTETSQTMRDKILEALIEKYKERAEKGQLKYGTTLDRNDLELLEWVNHAQEEAMDYCLYLEKIKQMLTNPKGINIY